ncbi:MAG: acetolactate synthase small subunit [Candidatus Schekmanbacteria bacterium RIFCSPHIGHO2_02_FULL_38_11]|uniref:Acetolactate synthase small subunit n=1 Tax=Candidatus Schekmanbacteria bacterium RIFCSPLOWO2_12_FULL_38_15 TaxID=1817883 RepID=A0A1F7SJU2_9BACT|nr:MAG: acetolactate synthase small subunit [Candidatus Schekmanbacteria bacterium GWA2_38_9]OGL51733.1 MAG: acetolactate synthase small subunit [Candidatus Schekmanbacteria bacterium RIFCSPLOWO2_02_FULL_38_14]OGL52400.1 MAG: acetolactate synthase small subunit [Candidatus Schekmanbacteria bacterium RIFCSPHIGHO2_02_FULL_38_11]OGL54056.1 MAG: acetolactate synthase small subunit [Candidatus Schekmanbacteria bacterium RIFCSPLOWO2_12_FULL_38_15]
MRHTISILVENKFGVLARVSGLFSSRGFNIESLSVGETADPSVSRMTIVTKGDDQIIEQVIKQLRRLIDVIKVTDLSEESYVERELVLIKVNADSKSRTEMMEIVDIFRGKIIDVSPKSYVIEVTGDNEKIDAIIGLLKPIGIKEIARTGSVAMSRGVKKEK